MTGLAKLKNTVRHPMLALRYWSDLRKWKRAALANDRQFEVSLFPCLTDRQSHTSFDRHYIYHPAWAARILAATKPTRHIDFSSTLHFAAQVSAFLPVEFYDYRPAHLGLSQLATGEADLCKLKFSTESLPSVSCMHVLEHVGLGRYGDPLDPEGDVIAARELTRVVAPGGDLLIVVPVGKPRVEFNAHRIYSYEMVCSMFSELELVEFALIPDLEEAGGLIRGADSSLVAFQNYACGCFHFKKRTLA